MLDIGIRCLNVKIKGRVWNNLGNIEDMGEREEGEFIVVVVIIDLRFCDHGDVFEWF